MKDSTKYLISNRDIIIEEDTVSNLEEIRARCDKATPGPWKLWEGNVIDPDILWADDYGGLHLSDADAEFIVHARTDIPTLLAEIDRLKAALEAETVTAKVHTEIEPAKRDRE